ACLALLQSITESGGARLIVALFCVGVWAGVRYLGYKEFRIAATLVRENDFRSMIRMQVSLSSYDDLLQPAKTPEECWEAIRAAAHEFGFSQAGLHLGGRSFIEQLKPDSQGHWISHVPLSHLEYVQLARGFEEEAGPLVVAQLIDLLHRRLSEKALECRLQAAARAAAVAAGEAPEQTSPEPVPTRAITTKN